MEGMQSFEGWIYQKMGGQMNEPGVNSGILQCTAPNFEDPRYYFTVRVLKACSEKIVRLTVSEDCPDLVLKLYTYNYQRNGQFS